MGDQRTAQLRGRGRLIMTKSRHQSAVTNGSRALAAGADGRSTWARRFKDIYGALISDLGGENYCSEAKKSIARRAATLAVELETQEAGFAIAGGSSAAALEHYARVASSQRRLLEALGLQRAARDITPDLSTYVRTEL